MGYNYLAKPIVTSRGFVRLGPSNAEPGDVVVLLFEGSTPFVLRPRTGRLSGNSLIGEAYVYGLMDGELAGASDSITTFQLL